MTVSAQTPRHVRYLGDGGAGPFALPFPFLEAADIRAQVTDADGVTSPLTGLTVTGAGDPDGGAATTAAPVLAGQVLTLWSATAIVQTTDYIAADAFPADSHERALDRLTLIAQDLKRDLDRSLKVRLGETPGADTTLDAVVQSAASQVTPAALAQIEAATTLAAGPDGPVAGAVSEGLADLLQSADSRMAAIGAAVGATIHPDTAAGLAATPDQGYFWVAGTGDAIAKLYRDNAGVAVLIAESPSQEATSDVLTFAADLPLSPDGTKIIEYALDGDGVSRLVRGIKPLTGAPVYPGLVTDGALDAAIGAVDPGPFVRSPPLALNGEVPLVIFGSNRRALTINPTTGLLTPSQAGATGSAYDSLFPSDARLRVSDYWSITEQSPTRLRFLRGITNGNAYQNCSPGSRVGLYTNARVVRFRLYWNGLVTRDDVQNFIGGVLSDGTLNSTFTNPFGATGTGESWVTVDFGSNSTTARKVELIWPYGDGMDLLEVQVSRGAAVVIAPARPTTKLVVAGDSITHGFNATNIFTSWAWQLAVAKGYQLINIANGSERVVAANANVLSETAAQHVIYAIGYNDFASQLATATFQSTLQSWLINARAELPSARLYVASMLYTSNTNTITPAHYRTATAAAVTVFADGNTEYVDGLTLMTNSGTRLADGIHPNDTGAAELATAWASIID